MKRSTWKCALTFAGFAIAAELLAGQAFAIQYFHVSRPRLGFEVSYEFENDKRSGPFTESDIDTTTYSERLDIETNGWAYHPALVEFDITLSPQWEQTTEAFEGADKQESRTFLQGYDAELVFLQYKPYTITLFGNKRLSTLNSSLAQRSTVEADNYGARLNLKYNVLPTILDYSHYEDKQSGFISSAETKDEARLNMRYDENLGTSRLDLVYFDLEQSGGTAESNLISKEASFQNIYGFPGSRKASLISSAGYRDRHSDTYLERGVNWYENLLLDHSRNLSTRYNLRYESYDLGDDKRRERQAFDFQLSHQLYENLTTTVHADTSKNQNEGGREVFYSGGLDWNYIRRIPGGSINASVSHAYGVAEKNPNSSAITIEVRDELISLSGNTVVLLNNKHIEISSLRVIEKRTADGLRGRTYIENTDYVITAIGDFTGISRKAGTTAIPDGSEVFVDYNYVSEPPFDYSVFDRSYGIIFNLWNSLKIHYRYTKSNQYFLRGVEPEILRSYLNQTMGLDYKWRWSSTTLEYTSISSTETPTESWKASELLIFRPTDMSYLNFSAGIGAIRFKNLEASHDTERFQNYKASYQLMLSQRQRLVIEQFINMVTGVINKTQETGFSSLYEWSYNIYKGHIKYTAANEKDMTSRENFINHLFMVTITRDLF
ncbi:MAG: hypothetical protein HZC49_14510 [Nitrospirae bacterium]|nr:hypothetical protein [Nitrospirota bacterium]